MTTANREYEAPVTAPWPDFAGNPIRDKDRIRHPDGTTGTVLYLPAMGDAGGEAWRVVYEHGDIARLALQIGDMGRAVVVRAPAASMGDLLRELVAENDKANHPQWPGSPMRARCVAALGGSPAASVGDAPSDAVDDSNDYRREHDRHDLER